jgi:outer membrane protein
MSKTFSIIILILFATFVTAQKVYTLSAPEAVKLALANAEELKNLQLDVAIQASKNREILGTAYPQVTGSGSLNYYFALPQIQFPNSNFGIYEVLQKEGVRNGAGQTINLNNATFTTQNVSFVAPFTTNLGVGVSQLLFQPDVFVAVQAREEVLNFAKVNASASEEKVKEAVRKAYYQVLIAEEQKTVLVETLKRLEALTAQTNQMFKQGFVEKLDVEKLQVTINNTQTAVNQVNNGIRLAKSALKTALGVSIVDSLVLTENLDVNELRKLLLIDDSKFSYDDRKELSILNTAKRLEDLNMRRHKYGKYPTLAAFANYSANAQRNAAFNPEEPWFAYGTGIMGLNLSIPIYDGGQRKQRIEQSKLSQQKLDNNIGMIKRYIDFEKDVAISTITNAILNLEVQERNIQLAKQVFETTKKKYESGLGSSFELIQSETELQRAQGGFYQALYDGYLSKIAWDKAVGKL